MNTAMVVIGTTLAIGLASSTVTYAAEFDDRLCKGGYPVLLMTEQECRSYTREVHVLESEGKTQALAALRQRHAEQLSERAVRCPCLEQPRAVAPQHVVMLESDC